MKQQHHIIYVPGIGDDSFGQGLYIKFWRLYGVRGHLHEMPWAGEEAYEPKFRRLLAEIDRYKAGGHLVSLIGPSAGATAVLNAYLERKDSIAGVALVCAKINNPDAVSKKLFARNPAFKTSIYALQDKLGHLTLDDKAKMRSVYSPGDSYVTHDDTVIPGVVESILPSLRHGRAIIYSVTLGVRQLLKPLKKLAKNST